jgi:glycyl-radical enzyme activating protein
MCNGKGLIFDVQGFSVHDGPGSRTTVFLSGCPLACEWCANPEGREYKQQLMYSDKKCKSAAGCRRCAKACPAGALSIEEETVRLQPHICERCTTFDCAKACYHEALRLSGKWYTVEELMAILQRDRQFWENGGVTFSGGEPFFQKGFLLEALKACKNAKIHTAIETAAFADPADFLEIMSYIDFAFIDLKHMDKEKHKEKTAADNSLILKNISNLKDSKWQGRLILRMPVIRSYNDSVGNIKAVIGFMKANQLCEINILPFHRMGESKWSQLGLQYEYKDALPTTEEELRKIRKLFLNSGLTCYAGDEIIY